MLDFLHFLGTTPSASPLSIYRGQTAVRVGLGCQVLSVTPTQDLIVLVVEDEFLIRMDVAAAFEREGWTVLEANNAESALKFICAERSFDVLFTDIDLSGSLTGWDIADVCRAHHKDVAVVYSSGVQRDQCRQVEASLFFEKPYRPDEVVNACSELNERMEGKQARG